jgi:serine/threonine protein kinase/CubicO group peptidase (beta-lactamase class C family)/WD40 repeat protein
MANACSGDPRLHRLAEAELAADEWEQLARHLESCPACFGALGQMPAARARLEARVRRDEGALAAQLAALVERLRARSTEPTEAIAPEDRAGAPGGPNDTPTLHHPGKVSAAWQMADTQVAPQHALPSALPRDGVDLRFDFLSPPQAPGELGRLGDFRILRLLGQGGMGIVFHAEDVALGRPAALKVMRPDLARIPEARQRFIREARAMASVDDAHVVTIFKIGEFESLPFLAMELLQGQNLEKWLESGGRPTPAEIVHLGIEVALGLEAAHRHGLVHRDIKPTNLWLEPVARVSAAERSPWTTDYRVKLLDFGLARPVQDTHQLTLSGLMVGTPAYMAPEQAEGEGVTTRSDLFSLGCVLYRLSTGQMPFAGATAMAVLKSVALKEPTPPAEINRDIPPALSNLIMRLLAKNPAARPASAAEVVEALRGIEAQLVSDSTLVPVPRLSKPPASQKQRRRWPLVAGVVTVFAIAGFATWLVPFYNATGIVELQSQRPGVRVLVRREGALITTLDLKAHPTARLRQGEYQLRLQENDPTLKLEAESIRVRPGEHRVIHVLAQKVESPPVVIRPPEPPPVQTPQEELATIGFLKGNQAVAHDVFQERFERWLALLKEAGFRPVWVNGFAAAGEPHFAGVALKDDGKTPWSAAIDPSPEGFQTRFDAETARGLWPSLLCGYTVGKSHGFVSVWQPAPPTPRFCLHALDPGNLTAANTRWMQAGLQPLNVSAYSIDKGHVLTALYGPCAGAGWTTLAGLAPESLEGKLAAWRNKGYRPISLQVTGAAAAPRFDAVLVRDNPQTYWLARVNLSGADLTQQLGYWAERGYQPQIVIGYPTAAGESRFAAVWSRVPGAGDLPISGTPIPELEAFDEVMLRFMRERKVPAGTLAVMKDGKLLLARGYGFADRERSVTVEPNIPFRLAGLGQPFLAAAIQKFIRDGKLSADARVVDELDIQPPAGRQRDPRWGKITIQHLLEHRGGWDAGATFDPMHRSLEVSAALGKTGPASSADIIRFMAGEPLQFEPGSKSIYSNFGFCLLGRVVEKLSGKSYVEYLRESLRSQGLTSIEGARTLPGQRHPAEPFYDDPGKGKNVVDPKGEATVAAPDGTFFLEAMDAHDGLIGSAPDVARFLHAFRFDGKPAVPEDGGHYGSLPGTFSAAIRRGDGVIMVALFNRRVSESAAADYAAFRDMLNQAANGVKSWPRTEASVVPIVTPRLTLVTGHTDKVHNVRYSPDAKWLATSSQDGSVRVYEAATGKPGLVIPGKSEPSLGLAFTRDSRTLIHTSHEPKQGGDLHFWDIAAGKEVKTLEASPKGLFDVQVSPDGKQLACGGWDKNIRIYNLETLDKPMVLPQPELQFIRALSFAPNGERLAAVGDRLSVWNLRTGQLEKTVPLPIQSGVQMSPTDQLIATSSYREGEILFFDISCNPLGRWKAHPTDIYGLAFSPDATRVASAGTGGKVWLWDVAERRPVAVLFGHHGASFGVTFAPDGKTLATTGFNDHTCRLWDVSGK